LARICNSRHVHSLAIYRNSEIATAFILLSYLWDLISCVALTRRAMVCAQVAVAYPTQYFCRAKHTSQSGHVLRRASANIVAAIAAVGGVDTLT